MLSSRLIQMIEDHWEPITAAIVRRIRADHRLEHVGKLPESELRERAEQILHHLGHWLVGSNEGELKRQFEQLGAARFASGIPLEELVLAYQLIKAHMIDFIHHQGLDRSPVEIYAHHELQHAVDRVFRQHGLPHRPRLRERRGAKRDGSAGVSPRTSTAPRP